LKKHFFIIPIGIILGFLLSYYLVVSTQNTEETITFLSGLLSSLLGVLVSYIIYFTTLKFDKILPWHQHSNNRLLFGLVVHYLLSILISVTFLYAYFSLFLEEGDFFIANRQYLIKLSILIFIIIFIYSVVYFALFSYYSFATLQIETVKQERKQIDLQLKALKSQLSPHFLFNCLNTISSLAHANVDKADLFIRRLVKMYQYTLNSYNTKLIILEEELRFLESYQYLIMTRFENKLFVNIDIPKDILASRIPPLTLQMLLENSVKHNVLNVENPLKVSIFIKDNAICIQNNITETSIKATSFHIGLKNINSRYLLLAGKGISITNGSDFSVSIPIIR